MYSWIEYKGFTIFEYFGGAIVREFEYEDIFGDVDDAKNGIDQECIELKIEHLDELD